MRGRIEQTDSNTLEVKELPIGTWTQTYKEFLETLMTATEKTPAAIKDYREYHSDTTVHFVINLTDEQMTAANEGGDLYKKFKLESSISTSNMVLFDPEGRIKKYETVEEILSDFYQIRIKFYQERKVCVHLVVI